MSYVKCFREIGRGIVDDDGFSTRYCCYQIGAGEGSLKKFLASREIDESWASNLGFRNYPGQVGGADDVFCQLPRIGL